MLFRERESMMIRVGPWVFENVAGGVIGQGHYSKL
jgi:hypothetical protein